MAGRGFGQVRRSNPHPALYSDDNQRIEITRDIGVCAPPNFGFRGVVNIIAKHLFNRAVTPAVAPNASDVSWQRFGTPMSQIHFDVATDPATLRPKQWIP